MKVKQISDKTFKEHIIDVDDELYESALKIQSISELDIPLIVSEDGKSINVLFKGGEREVGERDTHKYIVKITKQEY